MRRARARRRRLCREALLAARGGGAGQRDPEARRPRARRGRARKAAGRPRPAAARSRGLGGALGRRAGAGHRHRIPAPAAARQPAVAGLHAATRSSTGCTAPASRSPTAPSTAISATCAHKFAERGGGDLIETRAGIGYRIGRCLGGARLDPRAQGLRQAPLAGAAAAHDPVPDLPVRRRSARASARCSCASTRTPSSSRPRPS